jgi:hypothetical protein
MKKHYPFLLVEKDGKSLLKYNEVIISHARTFRVVRGGHRLLWFVDAVVLTSPNMAEIK